MRITFIAIFVALLTSCATTPDPIDHLVADLSATHGLWINGIGVGIDSPKTASTEQLVEQVFKKALFNTGRATPPVVESVTSYKILRIRQVRIQGIKVEKYTAVLVQTNLGEKIVLLKFQEDFGHWWFRYYDANQAHYYEKKPA